MKRKQDTKNGYYYNVDPRVSAWWSEVYTREFINSYDISFETLSDTTS